MGVLELIFKKHNQWIDIVKSFGCNRETAEDLVQEMYIKIQKQLEDGRDIMFNETEVNYYYIFRTLNTLFLDLKRKEKNHFFVELEDSFIVEEIHDKYDYNKIYQMIQDELSCFHWYDQKIYQIIEGGKSMLSLSEETKISYYSLYNTYNRVKRKLKKKLKL